VFASLSFLGLAIWGWGVSIDDLYQSLLILISLLLVLITAAGLMVGLFVLVRKVFKSDSQS
jgi:hypothetical protein